MKIDLLNFFIERDKYLIVNLVFGMNRGPDYRLPVATQVNRGFMNV